MMVVATIIIRAAAPATEPTMTGTLDEDEDLLEGTGAMELVVVALMDVVEIVVERVGAVV